MIVYDFEVFKHDWMICYLDLNTRKMHSIINDVGGFEKFYKKYKNEVWVGYNSRGYDQWIAKAILAGFHPYKMSQWIIEKERKGFMFSDVLQKFPILNYDCSVGFRSLKELEAFMGDDIQESDVPFDIDRKLTPTEILKTKKYCEHDVMETFKVFLLANSDYEAHVGLLQEFNMPLDDISKTKAQLSAMILGASKVPRNDEFDISFPDTLALGRYNNLIKFYENWAKNERDYSKLTHKIDINGVPHVYGIGGLHGAINRYLGEGYFLMADVDSYYPAMMIEYDLLSRNVMSPKKYKEIRDTRLNYKAIMDVRQLPYKIVLNGTFGASKDKYNKLYDPLQANNVCIYGQLFLTDLLDKLDGKCQLIQTNTDGILVKLYHKDDRQKIIDICEEWSKRTRMTLGYDDYRKVIQKDVNNYILIPEGDLYDKKGKPRWKAKGAYVKKLSELDNDLPIVNRAIVNYFIHGKPVMDTVYESNKLIDFQKVTKIGRAYEYAFMEENFAWVSEKHEYYKNVTKKRTRKGVVIDTWVERVPDSKYGRILQTRVNRCFASRNTEHGMLYKKKRMKTSLDKIGGTPDHCFVINDDISEMSIPSDLDRMWYVTVANERINEFLGR